MEWIFYVTFFKHIFFVIYIEQCTAKYNWSTLKHVACVNLNFTVRKIDLFRISVKFYFFAPYKDLFSRSIVDPDGIFSMQHIRTHKSRENDVEGADML